MTGRASFLRRLRALEDRAGTRASVGGRDGVRALAAVADVHLSQLEEALSSGRIGEEEALGGPRAVRVLALPEGLTGPDRWARAYLLGEALPPLPEGSAAHFGGRAWDAEEKAADLPDGEEKTRLYDGAAVWAFLEALARVLEEKGEA